MVNSAHDFIKSESPRVTDAPTTNVNDTQALARSISPPLPSPPELSFDIKKGTWDEEEAIITPSPPDLSFSFNDDDDDEYEEVGGARSSNGLDGLEDSPLESINMNRGAGDRNCNQLDSNLDDEEKTSPSSLNLSIISEDSFSKVISSFKNVGSPARVQAGRSNQYPKDRDTNTVSDSAYEGVNNDHSDHVSVRDYDASLYGTDAFSEAGPSGITPAVPEVDRNVTHGEKYAKERNEINETNEIGHDDNNNNIANGFEINEGISNKTSNDWGYDEIYLARMDNSSPRIDHNNPRRKTGDYSSESEKGTLFDPTAMNTLLKANNIVDYYRNNPGKALQSTKLYGESPKSILSRQTVVINETLEFNQGDLHKLSSMSGTDYYNPPENTKSIGQSNDNSRIYKNHEGRSPIRDPSMLSFRKKRKYSLSDNIDNKRPLLNRGYEEAVSSPKAGSIPSTFESSSSVFPQWDRTCWDVLGRFLNVNREYAKRIAESDCLPVVPEHILKIFGDAFEELEISQRLFAAARIKSKKLLKAA